MTRIFLTYAEGDDAFRDKLISQARISKLPVEFFHMTTKMPWVPNWKGACRARVFQCDGAIVLVTKKTPEGNGIKSELEFVCEAQLPVLGVSLDQAQGSMPEQVRDSPLIGWNWAEIARFIQSLSESVAG